MKKARDMLLFFLCTTCIQPSAFAPDQFITWGQQLRSASTSAQQKIGAARQVILFLNRGPAQRGRISEDGRSFLNESLIQSVSDPRPEVVEGILAIIPTTSYGFLGSLTIGQRDRLFDLATADEESTSRLARKFIENIFDLSQRDLLFLIRRARNDNPSIRDCAVSQIPRIRHFNMDVLRTLGADGELTQSELVESIRTGNSELFLAVLQMLRENVRAMGSNSFSHIMTESLILNIRERLRHETDVRAVVHATELFASTRRMPMIQAALVEIFCREVGQRGQVESILPSIRVHLLPALQEPIESTEAISALRELLTTNRNPKLHKWVGEQMNDSLTALVRHCLMRH